MTNFLKQTWYMIGWAGELDEGVLARTVADTPVVAFRDKAGIIHAIHDRCPHRFAPLSKGIRKGDAIMCHYHGLTFDGTGACIDNPLGGPVPAACRVPSYPAVEQDGMLWVWLGDPALADPARIVRFPWLNDDGLRSIQGYTQVDANYELLTDNLMDLTHAKFLHPGFGGDAYSPRNTMEAGRDTVLSKYIVVNIDNPEFPENAWSAHGQKVDLWDDIRWHAPATLSLSSGVVLTGRPREEGCEIPAAHVITPETAGRSHYFWGSALPKDSPLSNDGFREVLSQAFDAEDKPMIEAAQQRMGEADFWELGPVLLTTDAPAVRVRRILREMIGNEKKSQAASAEMSAV